MIWKQAAKLPSFLFILIPKVKKSNPASYSKSQLIFNLLFFITNCLYKWSKSNQKQNKSESSTHYIAFENPKKVFFFFIWASHRVPASIKISAHNPTLSLQVFIEIEPSFMLRIGGSTGRVKRVDFFEQP